VQCKPTLAGWLPGQQAQTKQPAPALPLVNEERKRCVASAVVDGHVPTCFLLLLLALQGPNTICWDA
jgi:hypothetical protein